MVAAQVRGIRFRETGAWLQPSERSVCAQPRSLIGKEARRATLI